MENENAKAKELNEQELANVSGGDYPPGTPTVFKHCPKCQGGNLFPTYFWAQVSDNAAIACMGCKQNSPKADWF